MSNLYRKIYTGSNILDYYKYTIDKLKNEIAELEEENKNLKVLLEKDEEYKRIQGALKKLNASRRHYKSLEENSAVNSAIKILKGESE